MNAPEHLSTDERCECGVEIQLNHQKFNTQYCTECGKSTKYATRPKEKMLACPFCGSDDIDAAFWKSGDGKTGPGCMTCGGNAESIEAWNKRVSNEPLDARELIEMALPVMEARAERHHRKSIKAKTDIWSQRHSDYSEESDHWVSRARSFIAASPPAYAFTQEMAEQMHTALRQIATGAGEEYDGLTYEEIAEIANAALIPSQFKRKPSETGDKP